MKKGMGFLFFIFVGVYIFGFFSSVKTRATLEEMDRAGNEVSINSQGLGGPDPGTLYSCGQVGHSQGACFFNDIGFTARCPSGTQDIVSVEPTYNSADCSNHVAWGSGGSSVCCVADGSATTFCAVNNDVNFNLILTTNGTDKSIIKKPNGSFCSSGKYCYNYKGNAYCKGGSTPNGGYFCPFPGATYNGGNEILMNGGNSHFCDKTSYYCYNYNNLAYCIGGQETPNGTGDFCPFPGNSNLNKIASPQTKSKWYSCGNYPCYVDANNVGTCDVSSAVTPPAGYPSAPPNDGSGSIPSGPSYPSPTLICNNKEKNGSFDSKSGNCTSIVTAVGTVNITANGFINAIFGVILGLSGGVALILIIFSGFKLSLSGGNPEKVKDAQEMLTAAIVGLLFVIFSVVILQIIGVDILGSILPTFK